MKAHAWLRAWVAGVGGVGAAMLLAHGCGSDSASVAPVVSGPDSGDTADTVPETDRDGSAADRPEADADARPDADAGQPVCSPQPIPPDVPAGWQEYPIMDCKYRLYVPPSRDLLPPPLIWEPCTQDLGPDPYDCRQIKVDWPTLFPAPYAIGGEAPAYVDADGKVVMQLRKVYARETDEGRESAILAMVVEADGPVRQALWADYENWQDPAFALAASGVAPGKSSWVVGQFSGYAVIRDVSMGGEDTLLRPPVLLDVLESSPDPAWVMAGSYYYVETGYSWRVRGWDGTDKGFAIHGAGAYSPPTWVGPVLLFAYEVFPTFRVLRWTEQDGTRELVGFGNDLTKGAGYPGSDGKDLVWVQGEGLGPEDSDFPVQSIMTSPFSTDPSKIQPRRLRKWEPSGTIGTPVMPPAVGCGRAAFRYSYGAPDPRDEGLLIVRLSDGQSWILPNPVAPGGGWGPAIALTCDEVFAMYGGGGLMTILRVRLDSLGPGMPPEP